MISKSGCRFLETIMLKQQSADAPQ